MRVEQQREILRRSCRLHQSYFDVVTERGAVEFTDLGVGAARGTGRHDDRARRHAAQHYDGRARDRRSRYGYRDSWPMVSQNVSGSHTAPFLVIPGHYEARCAFSALLTMRW